MSRRPWWRLEKRGTLSSYYRLLQLAASSADLSGSCPYSAPSPIRSTPRGFRSGFDPYSDVVPAIVIDPGGGLVTVGEEMARRFMVSSAERWVRITPSLRLDDGHRCSRCAVLHAPQVIAHYSSHGPNCVSREATSQTQQSTQARKSIQADQVARTCRG